MTQTNLSSPAYGHASERRTNHRLRELIDEMLASIRIMTGRDLWTPEERAQAETDLARIMASVRTETLEIAKQKRRSQAQ